MSKLRRLLIHLLARIMSKLWVDAVAYYHDGDFYCSGWPWEVYLLTRHLMETELYKRGKETQAFVDEITALQKDEKVIAEIDKCLKTAEGKELLNKHRIVRYGFGIADGVVCLAVYLDQKEFAKRMKKEDNYLIVKSSIAGKFAEELIKRFPHLSDLNFYTTALPFDEKGR